jgi:hypothetical protein
VTNNDFLAERSIRLPLQLHRRTTTSWARPTGRKTNGGQFSQAICLQKICKQKIPQSFNLCYRVGQIAAEEQNNRRRSRFDVRVKDSRVIFCFCHLCFYLPIASCGLICTLSHFKTYIYIFPSSHPFFGLFSCHLSENT